MKKFHNKILPYLCIILTILLIFKLYKIHTREGISPCLCANMCLMPCKELWNAGIFNCPPTEIPPCPGGLWPLAYDATHGVKNATKIAKSAS